MGGQEFLQLILHRQKIFTYRFRLSCILHNAYVFLLNVFNRKCTFSGVPAVEISNKSQVWHERAESIQCIRKKGGKDNFAKETSSAFLLKVAKFQRLFPISGHLQRNGHVFGILCKVVLEGCVSWPLGYYSKSPHLKFVNL